MERKEFIRKSLWMAFATVGGVAFLEACKKYKNSPAPDVDFTIDISTAQYSSLQNNGSYVYDNNIIIARDNNGNFIALSEVCTHAGCTVKFNGTSQFPCPCHGSLYDSNGNVIKGPAKSGLKKYNTALNGTMLHIYG